METKKSKKKIIVLQIVIIIVLIIAILYVGLQIYANMFWDMSHILIYDYEVATDELMDKYYGKRYVKKLEKNIEKEEEEIMNESFKPKSSGIKPVENALAMYSAGTGEELVQVVADEDIPIAKSEEQWYLDLIDIYYNKPITEEDKYYIAERLEIFYRDLSKKNGYEELKGKIEAILIENNLVVN